MNLYLIPLVFAMGDPSFVPGNPSGMERMGHTTSTLNVIHQNPEDKQNWKQRQEERDYNRNEPDLLLRMDDVFKEVTEPDEPKERQLP